MALLQRNVFIEKCEKNSNEAKDEKTFNELKTKPIDPKIYCRVGDFNLLLGNYSKGMFFVCHPK